MLIQRFLDNLPTDIPQSPVILDVGSCDGEQACQFAECFPAARIYAFEPHPSSVVKARAATAAYSNITVIEAAAHEFNGQTTLYAVDEVNPGASSLFVGTGVRDIQPVQ